jgi:DNA modification methylase
MSYPVFMPKPSTHRMHAPGSIVPHIRPKVFTDNQISRIEYNYYINSVSNDYYDSQRNRIAEDSITPQERQPGQHVA